MSRNRTMESAQQCISASLKSLFIGDALSMPVHWFYRPSDILRYFPPHGIDGMQAAPDNHPSSIMSLHSTDAGGRRTASGKRGHSKFSSKGATQSPSNTFQGDVVGDIILKGKRKLWGGSQTHYHHGMQAGDNTLNACCARLMIQHLIENGGYDKNRWLQSYIDFMTAAPPRHPDTYAESYHRGFFANLKIGLDAERCGAVTHDTPSMGALVTVAPLAIALFKEHNLEHVKAVCCEHVQLTHPDKSLMVVVEAYVELLDQLMALHNNLSRSKQNHGGSSPIDCFVNAASVVPGVKLKPLLANTRGDAAVVGGLYSTACYISDSWPSVCYLAAKYYESPRKALLVNTNLGGENAHRGSVLGTLVGIASGHYDHSLFDQLLHRDAINKEIENFLKAFTPLQRSEITA